MQHLHHDTQLPSMNHDTDTQHKSTCATSMWDDGVAKSCSLWAKPWQLGISWRPRCLVVGAPQPELCLCSYPLAWCVVGDADTASTRSVY